jgi:vancomycin resistance protein VanJ
MTSASRRRRSSGLGILLVLVATIYGAGALAAGFILLSYADEWWLGTVLVYGPRWPLVAPAIVLVPLLALARRPVAAALTALVGMFVAWPVMGWVPPLGGDGSDADHALGVRIVTFNAQGAELSDPRIVRLIEDHEPDVVVFQECGTRDDAAPVPSGYQLRAVQPLCFLSKFPFVRVDARDQSDVYARYGSGEIVLAELETPAGPIFVQNVHLETVREGLEAILHDRFAGIPEMDKNIEQRRWESELAREWTRRANGPLVVAGDFNLPVESAIYDRYWADLSNAFSECGSGYGNTKETRLYGVRIDHVLFDERWACKSAQVGPRIGSDHRPIVVDLELLP